MTLTDRIIDCARAIDVVTESYKTEIDALKRQVERLDHCRDALIQEVSDLRDSLAQLSDERDDALRLARNEASAKESLLESRAALPGVTEFGVIGALARRNGWAGPQSNAAEVHYYRRGWFTVQVRFDMEDGRFLEGYLFNDDRCTSTIFSREDGFNRVVRWLASGDLCGAE